MSLSAPVNGGAPVPPPLILADCPALPRWSFTQGVLFGQASIFFLVVLFLKYVVFEPPTPPAPTPPPRRRPKRESSKAAATTLPPSLSTTHLLHSLGYDLPSHAPESLDWLNVLLGQTLSSYRSLLVGGRAKVLLEEALNSRGGGDSEPEGMVGLGRIEVDEVSEGEGFPVLSSARVRPNGEDGGVRVELDLDFSDHLSLAISTRLLLHFPRPSFAILPISLGLTLQRFSGTLTLALPPPSAHHAHHHGGAPPSMHISLHPDFELSLSVTSLLGARAKLQDVPKVEQLIVARVRSWIQDKVVWPGRVSVALPSFGGGSGGATSGKKHATSAGDDDTSDGFSATTDGSLIHQAEEEHDSLEDGEEGSLTEDDGEPPSIEVDADGGPAIALHPTLTRRHPVSRAPNGGHAATGELPLPSPTESLPGYFGRSDVMGGGVGAGTTSREIRGNLGGTFGGGAGASAPRRRW